MINGCSSMCLSEVQVKNGSCSGHGCCQADIPKGVRSYKTHFSESHNTTDRGRHSSECSYLVVMEEASFDYSINFFDERRAGLVPVVMDWIAKQGTCMEAQQTGCSYACLGSRSDCLDSNVGLGYRCRCSKGYEGNPYIPDGCQDINECLYPDIYPCVGTCVNLEGSYNCSCPFGQTTVMYHDDGTPHMVCSSNVFGLLPPWVPAVTNKKHFDPLILIFSIAGAILIILLVLCAILTWRKIKAWRVEKTRAEYFKQNRGLLLQQLVDRDIADRMIFSYEELKKATSDFDDVRKLGGGSHGTVYKGLLSSNIVVAVKKSKEIVQSEIEDFINEVAILSQINHRNVVRLLGCCLEAEVPILVYEFIPNGSLSHHLYAEYPQPLSWIHRLKIAAGTAKALAYLHSSASIYYT